MVYHYKTIAGQSTAIHKVKGSKFLAFAYPVKSQDEINLILADFKKNYHDARHICYAWMLGADRLNFRSNDDGEPSGTAGRPILGQINSREITNILVVVVRYFGGVLLGTGGLVAAYKEAASEALNLTEIIEEELHEELEIGFDYVAMNEVMKIVKDYDLNIISQQFEMLCKLKVSVPLRLISRIKELFEDINSAHIISVD